MSLKSTETLLNIFFNKGNLQSDTQTINITDKTSKLKKDLAARDLLLLNNLPISRISQESVVEETNPPDKESINNEEPRGKSFKVNRELLDLGEKPSDNINTSSSSIRKKVLQQQLNELRNEDSRKKYIKKNKSKTKRKSST